MDHLTTLDASFLYIENEFNHMHIAVVAIFEGPPPRGDEIEEMVASKLPLVPRYRQKVRFVPFDLGRPVWSDDHHFNLRYHVRHTALPSPGCDEQFRRLIGRVMSQQLDRAKPLWEIWVVEGLEQDHWALLAKTHHCMVDGVSGSDLLGVLLDSDAEATHPRNDRWQPERRPTALSLLTTSLKDGIKTPRELVRNFRLALAAPGRVLHQLADLVDGISSYRTLSESPAETSLNGPIGPHRRWVRASTSLMDVNKIRGAHGGTVNDVVLSAITQGFRKLMLSRGEPVDGMFVRTLVPVSVRSEDERGEMNNRVSAMVVELPMEVVDPVERLQLIRKQMEARKDHHQAAAAEGLTSLSGFAPTALLALGARLFASYDQHVVQTVTTNVPGPRTTLYAAQRRMLTAYPYVPLAGSVRIGVAILSYAGQLTFGITGDYDTAADINLLADGIEKGIEDLLARS